MDYFDIVTRTNFKDQHKVKPASFAKIEEGKTQRVKNQAINRKSRRFETFDSHRIIEDEGTLSAAHPISLSKSEQRFQQLKKWKEEKVMKQQKELRNKIKPFTVGVVRHELALYKPVSPLKSAKNNHNSVIRTTRSTMKLLTTSNVVKRNTGTNIIEEKSKQLSFAPSNAKFNPPKVITSDSYTFGTKVGAVTRSKDMFTGPKRLKSVVQPTHVRPKRAQKEMPNILKPIKPAEAAGKKTSVKLESKGKAGGKEKQVDVLVPFNDFVERLPSSGGPTRSGLPSLGGPTSSGLRKTSTPEIKQHPEANQNCKLDTSELLRESSASYGTPDTKSSSSGNLLNNVSIVSPFVTVARGKGNLDREKLTKLKIGYVSENSPEKDAAIRFRLVLNGEIERLNDMCDLWSKYKDDNDATLPESAKDHIFQVIGQTKLLISKKFEQFRSLIDRCESQQFVEGGGAVVAQDLEGFWDMVFMQVEDIDLRFKRLTKDRDNGWVDKNEESFRIQSKPTNESKKMGLKKKAVPSKGLQALIQAIRMKKSTRSSDTEQTHHKEATSLKSDTKTFEAGFFSVTSPMKSAKDRPRKGGLNKLSLSPSRPPSFLKEVLSSEARKRLSLRKSTPSSVAMMRASQTAKWATSTESQSQQESMPLAPINLNATPAKSILKSRSKRPQRAKTSEKKSIKTVLFTESDDDLNVTKTLSANATYHFNSIPSIEVFSYDHDNLKPTESNERNMKENKENAESSRRATRQGNNTSVEHSSTLAIEETSLQKLKTDSGKKKNTKNDSTKDNVSSLESNASDVLPQISDLSLGTPKSSKKKKTRSSRSLTSSDNPTGDPSSNTPLRRSARLSRN